MMLSRSAGALPGLSPPTIASPCLLHSSRHAISEDGREQEEDQIAYMEGSGPSAFQKQRLLMDLLYGLSYGEPWLLPSGLARAWQLLYHNQAPSGHV